MRSPTIAWGLVAALAVACGGQEFAVGGAASQDRDGGAGGGTGGTTSASGGAASGGTSSSSGGATSGGGGTTGGAGGTGGASTGGTGTGAGTASGGATDGGATTSPEAGSSGGATADSGIDGGGTATGGTTACQKVTWYPDEDQDTYGRTDGAVVACDPPNGGHFATRDGDCLDTNDQVHPGVTDFFDTAYQNADGVDSFDFDCSGVEDPDPSLPGAAPACVSLGGLCGGSGYKSTGRTGSGVNTICGSQTKVTCTLGTFCTPIASEAPTASRCR